MIKKIYKSISDISESELQTLSVIRFKSEDGKYSIFIKNIKNSTVSKEGYTDCLEYKVNSFYTRNNKTYYFHRITCKKNDDISLELFNTAYEYIFEYITSPIEDNKIIELIISLEKLFKVTPEKDLTNTRIGLYGELLFLYSMCANGYKEILYKFHEFFQSKHDIELDKRNRIEIKTTTKEKRIHTFKHNLLVRIDIQVYVVSNILESSEQGTSLLDLFNLIEKFCDSLDLRLKFLAHKEAVKISNIDVGPKFSFDLALCNIRIINHSDLPCLKVAETDGITNIQYDVDCSLAKYKTPEHFSKSLLNKI